MNRSKAPQVQPIERIDFIKPLIFDINEKVKLYWMKEVPNETARMDLYFDAGAIRGQIGHASFVNGLLLSGTPEQTSSQISHELDLHGGFYESGVTSEGAVFSLYGLRENFPSLIRVLKRSIDGMCFIDKEVEEILSNSKQKFQVNMKKTSFLAQREFQKRLFHSSESYSRIAEETTYDDVSTFSLKKFFHKHYLNGLTKISLVGNFQQDFVDEIIDTFGAWATDKVMKVESQINHLPGTFHVEKEGAMQSTLRVGRILFNKQHPDFIDFQILNTLIGDYFGSRLMSNLREDKGYTYGVGSMTSEFQEFGYFLIAAEVGKENRENALKEIKFELDRLKTELVPEDELSLVKNYLLGQLLKSADGPYSMIDLYLNVEEHKCDLSFYNLFIQRVKDIDTKRIQELAIQYLQWEEMTIVSAG